MEQHVVADGVVHLRRAGTSLLVRTDARALPCILHWGPDLGDLGEGAGAATLAAVAMPRIDSVISSQESVALLPQHSSGWLGRPGLLGSRQGRAWSVGPDSVAHHVEAAASTAWPDGPEGAVRLRSVAEDPHCQLQVTTELRLLPTGLVQARATVRNLGADPYEVRHLEVALPVPADADELLDMTGRHTHERTPQRHPFGFGLWSREAWGGRPGHDSATLLCAGREGFRFRSGRVWGVHVAHSGNQVLGAEQSTTGWKLLRGGELLLPGEVRLATGEEYAGPWLVGSWGEGLDALSARFHRTLRIRPEHPRSPRPVLLNTWEAVYFHHDLATLLALADRAADIGVERFVLDDGWFRHRRHDRAGLGDWYVDEQVWPDGLHPLVERVRGHGMQFGLWFEPEMVNLDSDLARAHPDWLMGTEHGPGIPSRNQHVLDLGQPDAYDHVLARMTELVGEYALDFIKWDHNRALVDAGHGPDWTPGVHAQTAAALRLMATLKQRFPALEVESCSAGGGRADLAIMAIADRMWVSDCIDAHERQQMVRWTGLVLPPELMGTHVGSGADHTTGRSLALDFRAGTAVWGHMGVEWDLARAAEHELAALRGWIAFHKAHRGLLHTGTVVHADLANPALLLEGVVAEDGSEALYRLAAIEHTLTWPPGRVTLPGLDPDAHYRICLTGPRGDRQGGTHAAEPAWVAGATLTGRMLGEVGVQAPLLIVDSLVLIRAVRVAGPPR